MKWEIWNCNIGSGIGECIETNKAKLIRIPLNVKTITELMKRIYLKCNALFAWVSIHMKRIRHKHKHTHKLMPNDSQNESFCWVKNNSFHFAIEVVECWTFIKGWFSTNYYYYYPSKMYASFLKYKISFLSHCSAGIGRRRDAYGLAWNAFEKVIIDNANECTTEHRGQ